jgi:glyoxylase-like metal-dependent hydrolase (beta-lactamase superfamily II)
MLECSVRSSARARVVVALIAAASLWPRQASAQIDVSGEWAATFHEDLAHRGGMRLGDFTGLPLNEAGIRKGQAWDEDARSMRERQCVPHVVTYAMRGPASIRLSKVVDPDTGRLIAYSLHGTYGRPRTIWMDGRPHPSDLAPHTWVGFSTGRWERNTLVVTTTHVKAGWLQRNGSPTSDLTTMTEFFTRYDNNLLVATVLNDPVWLAEPFMRTTNFSLSLAGNANAWGTCSPAQVVDELPDRRTGFVPHYLPGQTAHIDDFLKGSGVPAAGARGGAKTLYPEFALKLQTPASIPSPSMTPRIGRVTQAVPADTGEVRVQPVQGNVYMLAGAGGNIAVQIGRQGVVVIDTGSGRMTDKVLAAIRQLSDQPIRYIVNTHAHPDHTGGNEALAKAGSRPGGGLVVAGPATTGAAILAHEGVLFAMSAPGGKPAPGPVGGLPTSAYTGGLQDVFLNGEAIQLLHQPAAHTNGDSLVFFRRSDVIVTGDIVDLTSYPVIDARSGGTFGGLLDALNRIIDLAVPEDWQDGGTLIVPSHGRVADESDIVEYRDMVTIVRDRVQDLIATGMTLDQVKAARPTFEYDGRYGSVSGAWTTDIFVEAVYRDLTGKRK